MEKKTCETFEENIPTTFIAFLTDFIDSNSHNFTISLYKKTHYLITKHVLATCNFFYICIEEYSI